MPKSSTLTESVGVIRMFPGFRSRWTMPRAWVASSAAATWAPVLRAAESGIGPRFSALQVFSTSSIARKRTDAASCSPYTTATFG